MKRNFLMLIMFLMVFSYLNSSNVKAETITKDDVHLRDDLISTLFFPFINREIEKHFGKPTQYYCDNIIEIKKLEPGGYDFDITIQVITFEGAHNPPNYLVTITFSNHRSLDWEVIDFKSKKLKPSEVECKHHPL